MLTQQISHMKSDEVYPAKRSELRRADYGCMKNQNLINSAYPRHNVGSPRPVAAAVGDHSRIDIIVQISYRNIIDILIKENMFWTRSTLPSEKATSCQRIIPLRPRSIQMLKNRL